MENQEIMEQFSENRQNYMMDNNSMQHLNVNVTSAGCGDSVVGGGVQADVVSGVVSGVTGDNLSVKYDEHHNEEHDVGDDDELKYVKEVQQSEKQQQQQSLKNFGLEADDGTASYEQNEMAEKEITNASAYHFGNGDAGFVFGENFHQEQTQQQQHHDLFNIGNGHNTNGHNDFSNSHGFEEKLNFESNDMDGFKNETDFSSSTNVTESAEGFEVPQVDVKIEAKPENQPEMQDEEEPSSLATNTTNGTSSLSENVPAPQAVAEPQQQDNAFDDFKSSLENKENTNPLIPQRPADLDLDLGHSQLNPDAKEFIPSFGSNPASPTSPFNTGEQQNDGVILSETMETQLYFGQAPSAVPRNLLNDDDFVAQSPLKGKGDNDLDAVPMPRALSEFEMEADKRPHELEVEQRDEVMTPDQAIQQLPLDNVDQEPESYPNEGLTDYDFLNHGPESCVDNDLDMQPAEVLNTLPGEDDVMKRSIYVANTEVIEDVLNSVQPLPTDIDSVNNSFIEESATESAANQVANDKELLQVEEKEHVSQSASIEEMQMNLLNALNSSNKDIPQLPIDTDSTNNMQESIYMGNEEPQIQEVIEDEKAEKPNKEDEQLHQETEFEQVKHFEHEVLPEQEQFTTKQLEEEVLHLTEETIIEKEDVPFEEPKRKLFYDDEYQNQTEQDIEQKFNVEEERLSTDTTGAMISSDSLLNNSFVIDEQQQEINESFSPFKISDVITSDPNLGPLNIDATDNQQQPLSDVVLSPSSVTADEKHLIEDTKEQHQQLSMSGLEQQMNQLILVRDDDNFSQPDEIVVTLVPDTIEDISENLISPDEIAVDNNHDQLQCQEQEKMLVNDDESSFNQQMEFEHHQEAEQDEQIEMSAAVNESDILQKSIESPIEQEEHKELESELVAVEEPIIETKQAAQLFTNTQETESETKIEEEQPQVDEICIEPQQQELPPSMVPETAPAEFLEPPMELKEETEQQKEQPIVEVASEPINETAVEENTKPEEEESIKTDIIPIEAAVVAATAAVAATAIAGAKAAASPSQKTETAAKQLAKTSTAAAKPKVSATAASKKPIDVTKKSLSLAAKPRATAAPTKTATAATAGADKKPITKPTTSTTTTARKPLSTTGTTASKVAAKPASTTSSARTATTAAKSSVSARPTTAPRTVTSSTTTRKPATTSSTTATTNAPTARPRPATAPAKPTTLGLSAANSAPKTKPSSPRATLTSQVRKTAPATTAAKSPVKSTSANGVNKTVSSSLTSKTKTTTSTASSTAPATGTKTFTARPAPKFTHSLSSTTTTTSTRRLTVGGTTTATSTTTMTTKTSSTPLRKSSPHKPVAGRTPTKSTTAAGALKSKTPVSKTASPAAKPAPIRKPVDKTANVSNNESPQTVNKQLNSDLEAVKQTVEQQQQQNGDTSIPMQNEEQPSLLEEAAKDGQMDAMNA